MKHQLQKEQEIEQRNIKCKKERKKMVREIERKPNMKERKKIHGVKPRN